MSGFCWILNKPDYLPWFNRDILRWAQTYDIQPSYLDIQTRAKWILLDKGIAATQHLQAEVKKNRGSFTNSVRTYRTGTEEEFFAALALAILQLGVPRNPNDFEWLRPATPTQETPQ